MLRKFVSHLPSTLQRKLRQLSNRWSVARGITTGEPEEAVLHHLVRKGDRVVDGGANLGHYTIPLSRLVGGEGRVLAFEPILETFALLTANVTELELENVSLFNVALSSHAGESLMQIPLGGSGLANFYQASIHSPGDARNGQTLPVLCLPLDQIVGSDPVALIKLDVEGHEEEAFGGMEAVVRRDHPILIVESRPPRLRQALDEERYRSVKLRGSPNQIFIPPERVDLLERLGG